MKWRLLDIFDVFVLLRRMTLWPWPLTFWPWECVMYSTSRVWPTNQFLLWYDYRLLSYEYWISDHISVIWNSHCAWCGEGSNFGLFYWLASSPLKHSRTTVRVCDNNFCHAFYLWCPFTSPFWNTCINQTSRRPIESRTAPFATVAIIAIIREW